MKIKDAIKMLEKMDQEQEVVLVFGDEFKGRNDSGPVSGGMQPTYWVPEWKYREKDIVWKH